MLKSGLVLTKVIIVKLFLFSGAAYALSTFTELDDQRPTGVSHNGQVVYGEAGLTWSLSNGYRYLDNYEISGCSNDGTRCVGAFSGTESFLWVLDAGYMSLNQILGTSYTISGDISADGTLVVATDVSLGNGVYLENGDPVWSIPTLDSRPYSQSKARAISGNGQYVAGTNVANNMVGMTPEYEAFIWLPDTSSVPVGLGDLPGGEYYSSANDVSENGVVVGVSRSDEGDTAFRWSQRDGMQSLGALAPGCRSEALAVSADGSVIVGESCQYGEKAAFIWTEQNGMQRLSDVLQQDYNVNLFSCDGQSTCSFTEWALDTATGISDDGKTIVGWGTNSDSDMKGWLVELDVFVAADTDNDGLSDMDEIGLGTPEYLADYNNDLLIDGLEEGRIVRLNYTELGDQLSEKTSIAKVSDEGRYTVFVSYDPNVLIDDTNGKCDVFKRDNINGQVELVSTTSALDILSDGVPCNSAIAVSEDARYVVFSSRSPELLPTSSSYYQLFLRDTINKTTKLITSAFDGGIAQGSHYATAVSMDGRRVLFTSSASNLVEVDSNGFLDVFLYEEITGGIRKVSQGFDGSEANGDSIARSMDGSGASIAYTSSATNIVSNPIISNNNAYLYSSPFEEPALVNVSSQGILSSNTNGRVMSVDLSEDGSFAAFVFNGDLIDTNNATGSDQVYFRDFLTGETLRLSQGRVGTRALVESGGDGVAYVELSDVGENDTNLKGDVYYWDKRTGLSQLITLNNSGIQGNEESAPLDIVRGGDFILFSSKSRNLVPGDTNEATDIFLAKSYFDLSLLPSINIQAPLESGRYFPGDIVELMATAIDPQEGDISSAIVWSSNLDGVLGNGGYVQTSLSEGHHDITAQVVGPNGTTSKTIYDVVVANAPPQVQISLPVESAVYTTADLVTFIASASDSEDGDLSSQIQWIDQNGVNWGYGASVNLYMGDGIYTMTANVMDQHGATASDSVSFTVLNLPPVAGDDSGEVNEGGIVTINLIANDVDQVEGIKADSVMVNTSPSYGAVVVAVDGSITYTHDGSETVTDQLTYTVRDNAGMESNVATVTINVAPVNDAPVAVADSYSLLSGATLTLDVIANDSDADDGLDASSISIVSLPAEGNVQNNGDGTLTYVHNGSSAAFDSFSYLIRDNAGVASNTATVSISIEDSNNRFPIENDFESGLPSDDWTYYRSNATYGRIAVVDGRLRMDVTTNGYFSLNEAILNVDLTGANNVTLSFFQADHNDESTSMPVSFVGHHNSDGVAISADGNTWYRAVLSSALEVSTAGQNYTVDLDAVVANIRASYDPGFGYGDNFKIKFQQYDNYAYPTDGREWDNINIDATYSSLLIDPDQPINISVKDTDLVKSGCESFQLTNTGAGEVVWVGSVDQPWISFQGSTDGTIQPNATEMVNVCWDAVGYGVGYQSTANIVFTDNATGEQITRNIILEVSSGSTFNYSQDFSSGLPSGEWQYYSSSYAGRIAVAGGRLRMDVTTNGVFSLNEAVLALDLAGLSGLRLSFFQAEASDERHGMLSTHTGHSNGDGVAISADGITWYEITSVSALDVGTAGANYSFDLDAEVARIQSSYDPSFTYTSNFKIKFQQYDNYSHPTDGREWDSIVITNE